MKRRLARLRSLLHGPHRDRPGYRRSRWLFLRLLGVVHLVAFGSLWFQLEGLVGSGGLLPVEGYLERAHEGLGAAAYWRVPTLCWLGAGDAALYALCAAGVLLSLLLIAGVASLPVLALLWALYLSLTVAGQVFLNFQWDVLLLEATLVSLFVAPRTLRPRLPRHEPPVPASGRWLLWLLLFKLMFLSGATKLLSGDPTWRDLTALDFHYYTQPLPAWTSWYAQQLPQGFQRLSVVLMYGAELLAPFAIFTPRRLRHAGAAAMVLLQVLIAATGNYGFFNLLSVALCVPLLDDALLGRRAPARAGGPAPGAWPRALRGVAFAVLASLSFLALFDELVATAPRRGPSAGIANRGLRLADRHVLAWRRPLLAAIRPLRSVNGYGLFRSMTTLRPEIALEVSADGRDWREQDFRWKPDDPAERPRFVAPHMPRLDWQMWFAALDPEGARYWLEPLLTGVLDGSAPITGLLGEPALGGETPRFARLVYYRYRFTTPAERAGTGRWWHRERLGPLTGPVGRDAMYNRPNRPNTPRG